MKVYRKIDAFPIGDVLTELSSMMYDVDQTVGRLSHVVDRIDGISDLFDEYIKLLQTVAIYTEDLIGFGTFENIPLDAVETNGTVINGKLYPYVPIDSKWIVKTTVEGHLYMDGSEVPIPSECVAEGHIVFYEGGTTEVLNPTNVGMLFDFDISKAYHLEVAVPVNYEGRMARIADALFKINLQPRDGMVFVGELRIYVKSGKIKDILVNGVSRIVDLKFKEPYMVLEVFDEVGDIWVHLVT